MKKQIFLALFIFVLVSSIYLVSAEWTDNLNDGLVYYYNLDDSSEAREGVNGQVNGAVEGGIQGNDGKLGSSYYFDGIDDRVNFGDVTEVEGINQLTISLWIKTNSPTGNDVRSEEHTSELQSHVNLVC